MSSTSHANESRSAIKITSALGGEFYSHMKQSGDLWRDGAWVRFFVIVCLITITYRENQHFMSIDSPLPSGIMFLMHLASCAAIAIWLAFATFGCLWMYRRGWINSLFLPVISLPMPIVGQIASGGLTIAVGGAEIEQWVYGDLFLKDIAVLICYETLFALFIVPASTVFSKSPVVAGKQSLSGEQHLDHTTLSEPDTFDDTPNDDANGPEVDEMQVLQTSVGEVIVSEISFVKSQGHYLIYHLNGRTLKARGTLRDLSDSVNSSIGVMLNRSEWVAFDSIAEVDTSGGKFAVLLNSGETLLASKARRIAFEMAYKAYVDGQ